MRSRVIVFVLAGLLTAGGSSYGSELTTEVTLGTGYKGNLFNDSSSTGDAYGSVGINLRYYPSASTQLAARGVYSGFADYGDLSNMTGDASITVIPTSEASPFSLTLAGALSVSRFGPLYQVYDQGGAMIGADINYRFAPWMYLQSSASYLSIGYTNSDYGSNRGYNLASGINISFLGSNSLALKVDYSSRSFDQPLLKPEGNGFTFADGQDNSELFGIVGSILRYSRPLGERTGLNLSLGHRRLLVETDYAVLGYTIDYLSPWANLWTGMDVSGGIKHFFPSQITTEFSFSYYDKDFVDVYEFDNLTGEAYWRDTRDDQLTALSLVVSKSMSLRNGSQLTPSIYLGYRKNQSTAGYYGYEDMSASLSLKIGL